MQKPDNKQYTRRESREKGENTAILPMSLKTDEVYVLENACQILGLSERFMKKIRVSYLNEGILKLGDSFVCVGGELLKILIKESALNE